MNNITLYENNLKYQIYSPKYTCWLIILLEIFFGVNVNSVSLIKIKIQNVEYLTYIQYLLINIQYIFRFCPIGNNLWRTFDFGASYFGAKLCFVSLAWIWVGKACSGKYDKKNKTWKTDSQEIPTTVIKKMDTGVYWVFVYLQVLIKLMKFL